MHSFNFSFLIATVNLLLPETCTATACLHAYFSVPVGNAVLRWQQASVLSFLGSQNTASLEENQALPLLG